MVPTSPFVVAAARRTKREGRYPALVSREFERAETASRWCARARDVVKKKPGSTRAIRGDAFASDLSFHRNESSKTDEGRSVERVNVSMTRH